MAVRAAECEALWPAITYSASKDTPETIAQIRRFNSTRDSWCGETK